MSTKHKLRATIPQGDPDLGAEVEVEIAFTYYQGRMAHYTAQWKGGYPHPDEADEIDFTGALPIIDGKPALYSGAFADMQMESLGELAADWLETDEGREKAIAIIQEADAPRSETVTG